MVPNILLFQILDCCHYELSSCLKVLFPWYEYLVRAGWTPDGQHVWVQLLDRSLVSWLLMIEKLLYNWHYPSLYFHSICFLLLLDFMKMFLLVYALFEATFTNLSGYWLRLVLMALLCLLPCILRVLLFHEWKIILNISCIFP